MIPTLCDICEQSFEDANTYGENTCPQCGQKYIHDEGQRIVLSEDQLQLLRAATNGPAGGQS